MLLCCCAPAYSHEDTVLIEDAERRSTARRCTCRSRRAAPLAVLLAVLPVAAAGPCALTVGIADQKPTCSATRASATSGIALRAPAPSPWDALTSPTQTRGARHLDGRAPAGGRRPADLVRRTRAPNRRRLPTPERLLVRVPPLPRALPVGQRVRDLERGQPLRRADLPPRRARRRLLPQACVASARRAGSSPPRSSTCRT